ncbi:MAG: hypothetical protein LBS76_00225 [Mycoplasmataceae bacterium]|nr:hypothetical protein [Mycoplasmataceae bacterium]
MGKEVRLTTLLSLGLVVTIVPLVITSCSHLSGFEELKVGDDMSNKYLLFHGDKSWEAMEYFYDHTTILATEAGQLLFQEDTLVWNPSFGTEEYLYL